MTTELIITIGALLFLLGAIVYLIRKGRKDAERIFEDDYYALAYFIRYCSPDEHNEEIIRNHIYRLSRLKGADVEKMQVLNSEFRRKFSPSLSDIVADHENY